MTKPKSILACDVGNSRISLGCVVGEQASHVSHISRGNLDSLGKVLSGIWSQCPQPAAVAACSVSPDSLAALESAARDQLGQPVRLVGRDLPIPIRTDVPEPDRVGTDRLCSAAMAYRRMNGPCVVADFGTAITIDCVDAEGVFLGGAILPGLAMSARALAGETAALPEVQLCRPDWVIGRDTRQAIITGIVRGARGALRELAEAYATELGHWPELILTGGDAELVSAGCDIVSAVVPDLSLLGVALAAEAAPPDKS